MLTAIVVAVFSAGPAAQQSAKVPKDSIQLVVTGCLKGRLLTTTRTPKVVVGGEEDENEELDAPIDRFQVSGKKAILDEVKKHDRKEVEVVGLVRKSDLEEPGIRVPGGRVVISPGRGGDRYGAPGPPPQRVALLQATSVKLLEGSCQR